MVRAVRGHPRRSAAPRAAGAPGAPAADTAPKLLPPGREGTQHPSVSPQMALWEVPALPGSDRDGSGLSAIDIGALHLF